MDSGSLSEKQIATFRVSLQLKFNWILGKQQNQIAQLSLSKRNSTVLDILLPTFLTMKQTRCVPDIFTTNNLHVPQIQ